MRFRVTVNKNREPELFNRLSPLVEPGAELIYLAKLGLELINNLGVNNNAKIIEQNASFTEISESNHDDQLDNKKKALKGALGAIEL